MENNLDKAEKQHTWENSVFESACSILQLDLLFHHKKSPAPIIGRVHRLDEISFLVFMSHQTSKTRSTLNKRHICRPLKC